MAKAKKDQVIPEVPVETPIESLPPEVLEFIKKNEGMLLDTTIVIQVFEELEPTLKDALSLVYPQNIIIYDDGSTIDLSRVPEGVKVIRSEVHDGTYEVALNACINDVTTKYLMKVNGGDDIIYAEEPKEGFQIFLARYAPPIPSHGLKKDFFKSTGSSFISGSVFETEIYKTLLTNFTPGMKTKWEKFGKYCGDTVLNSEWKFYLSEKVSLNFTYKMWGGKEKAFKVGKETSSKTRRPM